MKFRLIILLCAFVASATFSSCTEEEIKVTGETELKFSLPEGEQTGNTINEATEQDVQDVASVSITFEPYYRIDYSNGATPVFIYQNTPGFNSLVLYHQTHHDSGGNLQDVLDDMGNDPDLDQYVDGLPVNRVAKCCCGGTNGSCFCHVYVPQETCGTICDVDCGGAPEGGWEVN